MINCPKCGAYAAAKHRIGCPTSLPASGDISAYMKARWEEAIQRINASDEAVWPITKADGQICWITRTP